MGHPFITAAAGASAADSRITFVTGAAAAAVCAIVRLAVSVS